MTLPVWPDEDTAARSGLQCEGTTLPPTSVLHLLLTGSWLRCRQWLFPLARGGPGVTPRSPPPAATKSANPPCAAQETPATCRFSFESSARYTTPIPPRSDSELGWLPSRDFGVLHDRK